MGILCGLTNATEHPSWGGNEHDLWFLEKGLISSRKPRELCLCWLHLATVARLGGVR